MKLFSRIPLPGLLALAAFAAFALPSMAQEAANVEIPGYLNPATGTFRPKLATAGPRASTAVTYYNGDLQFVFNIKVASPLDSGQVILCTVTALVIDIPTAGGLENSIDEEGSTVATVNGSTGSCVVKIPYTWPLVNAAGDNVVLRYSLATQTPAGNPQPGHTARSTSRSLPSIPIPATGVTTVQVVDATI
jgi:hypothetical protein